MSEKDEFTIKEMYYSFQKQMSDQLKEVKEALTRLEDKADKNLVGITEVTGNLNSLKEWSESAQTVIESNVENINTLKNYRWWIIGFALAVVGVGYFALQTIVRNVVVDVLDDKATVNYEK